MANSLLKTCRRRLLYGIGNNWLSTQHMNNNRQNIFQLFIAWTGKIRHARTNLSLNLIECFGPICILTKKINLMSSSWTILWLLATAVELWPYPVQEWPVDLFITFDPWWFLYRTKRSLFQSFLKVNRAVCMFGSKTIYFSLQIDSIKVVQEILRYISQKHPTVFVFHPSYPDVSFFTQNSTPK